jgi:probable DNA metabolism protein
MFDGTALDGACKTENARRDGYAAGEFCYLYDGSFDGMLCCVFESFRLKELPAMCAAGDEAGTLLPVRCIASDPKSAARVLKGVREKIGEEAYLNTRSCYLAEFPDKEIALIRYLQKGFSVGAAVNTLLSDDAVRPLLNGVRKLYKEKGRFVEFLRFSDYDGKLVAEFEPEHNVLPLIAPHFTARFPNETFLIYDKKRKIAFVYADKKGAIIPVEELYTAELSDEEKKYRALWRMFYETAAIAERVNERARMQHLPKKYWKHMTEMTREELI